MARVGDYLPLTEELRKPYEWHKGLFVVVTTSERTGRSCTTAGMEGRDCCRRYNVTYGWDNGKSPEPPEFLSFLCSLVEIPNSKAPSI
jgi:hypothetical protein